MRDLTHQERDKVHWIYNDETDELDRVFPLVRNRTDFGKPNGHIIGKLILLIIGVIWVIVYSSVI